MKDIAIASLFVVLSGFVAMELGIATAIVEILAGIIVGEFTSIQPTGVIEFLAGLGILCLMYVAGLEIDIDLFRQNWKSGATIGTLSFIFPFVFILILGTFLGLRIEQALLAAIALSTTSIDIIYSTLLKDGSLDKKDKSMLSAAMITDLLCMSALALFFSEISIFLILFILCLFIFAHIFPFLGKRIFEHFRGNVVEFEFKIVLLLLLGVAIVSESVGIEAALLAFLVGMITSEVIVQHENLGMKLRGVVFGFFAPIFFFVAGLRIDLGAIFQSMHLLIPFLVVGYIAKYIGTYIPAKRYLPDMAAYMAKLFNSRLSIGIVAALLGLHSGIFNQEIYSAVVGAIILSLIISSVVSRKK